MPADLTTTSAAGRPPVVLARGVGLTAAVLAGAVGGHCLAGGHVPGPALLGAIAALVLVAGVLGARTTAGGSTRAVAVLAAAALAVALQPVLAMLAGPAVLGTALADTHVEHGPGADTVRDAAAVVPGPADDAARPAPDVGADAGPATIDLEALRDLVDLDAVRAAGTDLDALVAAGLDTATLEAAGLDPSDPHAPHTVASLVAAADRAAAAAPAGADAGADGYGDASVDAPRDASVDAPRDASVDAPRDAPWDASVDAPRPAARDASVDASVDAPRDAPWDASVDAPVGVSGDALAGEVDVDGRRQAALVVTVLATGLLALAVLHLPGGRRRAARWSPVSA